MNLKALLPSIKPISKDENGKYNRKLFNLLKSISTNEFQNRQLKIFFLSKCRWDDKTLIFHKQIHKEMSIPRNIIISPYGCPSSGYFLSEAIQKNKPEHWSLSLYDPELFIDATEWFFTTYKLIGRCMFDKYHYDFDNEYNNRYFIINKNNRKCRWCGEHFHREQRKHIEVRKYNVWLDAKTKGNEMYAKV